MVDLEREWQLAVRECERLHDKLGEMSDGLIP